MSNTFKGYMEEQIKLKEELFAILHNRHFKSLPKHVEYLYHAGYPIKEAYGLASQLYFKPEIDIISRPEADYYEKKVVSELDQCKIFMPPDGSSLYFSRQRPLMSKTIHNKFTIDFKFNTFWVETTNIPEADCWVSAVITVIENYLELKDYKIRFVF